MTKRQGKSGTIDVKALPSEDEEFLDSSRTPTANVADAKRSKASAVDESGPYGSLNFALNQRCTRAWLRGDLSAAASSASGSLLSRFCLHTA